MRESISSPSTPKTGKLILRRTRKKQSAKPSKPSKPHSKEIDFHFSDLIAGLDDALAHARGARRLKTTVLPKPAPKFSPAAIRAVRGRLNLSQSVFGQLLNVPVITIAKWEAGDRKPSGAALRLLEIAKRSPEVLLAV